VLVYDRKQNDLHNLSFKVKLDPKYFNLFIAVCAVVTIIAILYSTIRYYQNQEKTMLGNIENLDLGDVYLTRVSFEADSLQLSDFHGTPVLVDFWATWSGKSQQAHRALHELQNEFPELVIIAASVRDNEELVHRYVAEQDYNFIFVYGTGLYHEIQIPGVPSHILIDRQGLFFDFQVGEDTEGLEKKIKALVQNE